MNIEKENILIKKLTNFMEKQTGIKFPPDDYFTGIKTHQGKKYFNVDLSKNPKHEVNLRRLVLSPGPIIDVELNGVYRFAVFFDESFNKI